MNTEKISPATLAAADVLRNRRLHYIVTYPPHVGRSQSPKALVRVFVADGNDLIREITVQLSNIVDIKWVSRAYGDGMLVSCGNTDPAAHLHHLIALTLGLSPYDELKWARL